MDANSITIGLDLGNTFNKAVGLDADGKVLFTEELKNDAETLRRFFSEHAGAKVGMETGTHCRWISALAIECGCPALVGNARKLRLVFQSSRKNDWKDARKLAELCRASEELFYPVTLRDNEHHFLLQMLKARDLLVGQRTQIVNAIRGDCKADGVFIPKCDAGNFSAHLDTIPAELRKMFRPLTKVLEALAKQIRAMDAKIEGYVQKNFPGEDELLQSIPGVGPITSAAFIAMVPNPQLFGSAREAGPYFGLVPKQDQSGDMDRPCRITHEGSMFMRKTLMNAANYMLRDNAVETSLKAFGMRLASRGQGKVTRRKAKVALARKLAVVMLAMLRSGERFRMPEKTPSVVK